MDSKVVKNILILSLLEIHSIVIGNANITGWGIGTDNESLDAEIE